MPQNILLYISVINLDSFILQFQFTLVRFDINMSTERDITFDILSSLDIRNSRYHENLHNAVHCPLVLTEQELHTICEYLRSYLVLPSIYL